MSGGVVRQAVAEDAARVIALMDGLNAHVEAPVGRMTADILIRYGLGPEREFDVLVAEADGAVRGFAAFEDSFNTEHAAPGVYLIDLFVEPAARRRGLGRALIAAVAAAAARRGRTFLWWTVWPPNREGRAFYRRLGADEEAMIASAIARARFQALAAEGDRLLCR